MVEFGLKLEDNKVSDWSEHYIAYDKLKAILKKCKAVQTRYDDLSAKKPELCAAIAQDYEQGLATPSRTPSQTPRQSKEDLISYEQKVVVMQNQQNLKQSSSMTQVGAKTPPLSSLDRIREESRSHSGLEGDDDNNNTGQASESAVSMEDTTTSSRLSAQETTELVSMEPVNYGSSSNINITNPKEMRHSDSTGSFISLALEKATGSMSDYFGKSYERQVRDALKELEKYSLEFDVELMDSRKRVNAFYNDQLQELDDRLTVLKESVAGVRVDQTATVEESEEDGVHYDELETPLVRNRKHPGKRRASMDFVQGMAAKVAEVSDWVGGGSNNNNNNNKDGGGGHHRHINIATQASDEGLGMDADEPARDKKQQQKIKEADSIQRALVDQYRTAKLLNNFAIMNYTGFVKIVKKHDKSNRQNKGKYKDVIEPFNICNEGKAVEALADRMERLYANWFCNSNIIEARAQMLPKRGDGLEMDWSQLRLGYRMGMCSILGLWVCWDCVWGLLSTGKSTIGGRTAFPVFRATGGLLMLQWFWGVSVWVWTRYRINYIYLFDFNPHIVESPLAIFNRAVDNTLVFLLMMLLYYKAGAHDVPGNFPAGIFPFLLVVYTCFQLIFPLRTRLPMWQTIWEVITSPMTAPSFFHGYVGDIFTSMVKVFQDVLWTFFFVFSGDWMISEDLSASTKHKWSRGPLYSQILIPLLTLLPLWFRFNQCLRRYTDTGNRFPHLANAFKYALSQTVTLFGAFHPLYLGLNQKHQTGFDFFQFTWTTVFISSSLYSFSWDVIMDWGLGQRKYGFLGPRLMFPQKNGYFVIIAMDLVLRFAWVLTLVPPQSGASFALPQYMTAVSLMLELFRRTIWGFLRLENEHRSNASGFRRVGFVPLHFSTGHMHEYKKEKEHRGFSVLLEVAVVTLLVLGACTYSVVMAQHATERLMVLEQHDEREL